MIVLPIVLPEAHRAKVIAAALRESHKPAAGTRVWPPSVGRVTFSNDAVCEAIGSWDTETA